MQGKKINGKFIIPILKSTKYKFSIVLVLFFLVLFVSNVSATRLPTVGGDDNQWGTILNEFLNVSLNESGYPRSAVIRDSLNSQNLTIGSKITFSNGGTIENLINDLLFIQGGLNISQKLIVNNQTILKTRGFVLGGGTISKIGGVCNLTATNNAFEPVEEGDEITVDFSEYYLVTKKINDSLIVVNRCGAVYNNVNFYYAKPVLKIKNSTGGDSFIVGSSGNINTNLKLASGKSLTMTGDEMYIKAAQGTLGLEDPYHFNFYKSTSTLDSSTQMFSVDGEDGVVYIGSPSNRMGFTMYVGDGNWAHTLLNFDAAADGISYFGEDSGGSEHIWTFRDLGNNQLTINGPEDEVVIGDGSSNYIFKVKDSWLNTDLLRLTPGGDSINYFGSPTGGNQHIWKFMNDGEDQLTINGPENEIIVGDGSNDYFFKIKDVSGGDLITFNPNTDAISYFGSTLQDNIWKFRSSGDDKLTINGPDNEVRVYADFYVSTKSTPISCSDSTKGGIYFDTDDNHFYGCNGTIWVQLDNP